MARRCRRTWQQLGARSLPLRRKLGSPGRCPPLLPGLALHIHGVNSEPPQPNMFNEVPWLLPHEATEDLSLAPAGPSDTFVSQLRSSTDSLAEHVESATAALTAQRAVLQLAEHLDVAMRQLHDTHTQPEMAPQHYRADRPETEAPASSSPAVRAAFVPEAFRFYRSTNAYEFMIMMLLAQSP